MGGTPRTPSLDHIRGARRVGLAVCPIGRPGEPGQLCYFAPDMFPPLGTREAHEDLDATSRSAVPIAEIFEIMGS